METAEALAEALALLKQARDELDGYWDVELIAEIDAFLEKLK